MRSKYLKLAGLVLAVCMAFVSLAGCGKEKVATRTDFALDTVITIAVYGQSDEAVLKEPFNRIRELDNKLNAFSEDSEISKINAAAGQEPVAVSQDTFNAVKKGLEYSEKSGGAFDITIGPLVDLWKIETPGEGTVPEQSDIDAARALVDYRKVVLDEAAQSVFLQEPGMKINLGAIAKGFIGDEVKAVLQSEGVERAIINLGGNVVLIGGKSKREPFTVSLADPEDPLSNGSISNASTLGVLKERDNAVVTSGDYERYFIGPDGKRYHHILDPKTGYPAESGLHQVTVTSGHSAEADALSTSFFVMGLDQAMAYIGGTEGIEAVFVTEDNRIVGTKGMEDAFVFDEQHYGSQYTLEFTEP
ncbi:FAD:protein FMN transferase [Eubacterium sp. 1001713B170207_170306_E7]|uniref:FAD:protein FMN transferase n=1 Tax=Eubacterium sp. 1001713B170207_170306_E7 TaxID=2787097 RepID=UPI001899CAF1|nr:FAD:protein FMN transferase [Eubacterium sp. 1001713B170207_170306_E7]